MPKGVYDHKGTHGHAKVGRRSPTYKAWYAMLQRCTNPRVEKWAHYGGRGITVCDRWRTFANFLADMGEKPFKLTLERIDNDGNYEPGNCRWATQSEQLMNRRTTRQWECCGLTGTLTEWASAFRLNYYTARTRMLKYGTFIPDHTFILIRGEPYKCM